MTNFGKYGNADRVKIKVFNDGNNVFRMFRSLWMIKWVFIISVSIAHHLSIIV
ncbi:hypothetical protein J2772_001647 [Chryseobacterium jejuense]|nr:hypothetical protein [Chryseobacterium jejuense]